MKLVRQHDETDCGIACLAMMASSFASSLRLSALRQLAGTDTDGTNLFGLAIAARRLGLTAVAVGGSVSMVMDSLMTAYKNTKLKKITYLVFYLCMAFLLNQDLTAGIVW